MIMKKITVISDIHGRSIWEKIITKEKDSDLFIFLGDYFDSFDLLGVEQIHNFKKILEFKENNLDKVVLLVGNHDYHYMSCCDGVYSGYQSFLQHDIGNILHESIKNNLLSICFIYNKIIFSHAGISKVWLKANKYNEIQPLDEFINDLFIFTPKVFNFTMGKNFDNSGDDVCQTPIWIRPTSLNKCAIEGYKQIVGHTSMSNIHVIDDKIYLTDVYNTNNEYIIIVNNEIIITKL